MGIVLGPRGVVNDRLGYNTVRLGWDH